MHHLSSLYTRLLQEWYDFKANLSRVDYNTMQDRSKKSEPVTVINDYDTGNK